MKEERTEPSFQAEGTVTGTERLPHLPNVERIFDAFVRNANAVLGQARTTLGRMPESEEIVHDEFLSQKTVLADLVPLDAEDGLHPALAVPDLEEELLAATTEEAVTSQGAVFSERTQLPAEPPSERGHHLESSNQPLDDVDEDPGLNTQKTEAIKLVPDVASVIQAEPPVRERSEDGQIPARELERMMEDMTVLLRYGHDAEVSRRLHDLRGRYPRDLLLMRRIAEFHLQMGSKDLARETLFQLATGLFQRRNVTGMRAALEQILVLFPADARAMRLIGLLERR